MKLLSSAVSEETFCKYIGFHKAVKVLKYSRKCVFNDTSKCFLIYFEVCAFAVKYREMLCSIPSDRLTGKVLKLFFPANYPASNLSTLPAPPNLL